MKNIKKIGAALLLAATLLPQAGRAQSVADALQQLALDYQKLAGLKSILKQMYQGYEVVSQGYTAVKDVSKGNFNLHEAFLGGLLAVSPAVRNCPQAAAIIGNQAMLMSEYKSAYGAFRKDKHFRPDELSYMLEVYNLLVNQSLKSLGDLMLVMTDNRLRMSDAERISEIDRICVESYSQLGFLRKFNSQTYRVALQRAGEKGDQQTLKNLYGIN